MSKRKAKESSGASAECISQVSGVFPRRSRASGVAGSAAWSLSLSGRGWSCALTAVYGNRFAEINQLRCIWQRQTSGSVGSYMLVSVLHLPMERFDRTDSYLLFAYL